MFRKPLQYILKGLARLILLRYHPVVIGVTGNVGKTSTKDAIACVLSGGGMRIRGSSRNYNNEIGVPATILGVAPAGKNIVKWAWNLLRGTLGILWSPGYPKVLVLELALDRPGDIKYLVRFLKPRIGVVTAIGEIPVHVEFFSGPQAISREKSELIKALPLDGTAILNYDDEVVLEMKEKTKANVMTFGFGEGADVRATNYELKGEDSEEGYIPQGIVFKVEYEGSVVPIRLPNVYGKQQVYTALAAVAVGLACEINLVEISKALESYVSPAGRMNLLRGVKRTWIIDDTYNAAPISTVAALETLKELPAKRKIAVLGDMRELGKYTVEAHERIGEEAVRVCDILITCGMRAKFISDEARKRGFPENKLYHFNESQEAGLPLQKLLESGDVVLVKGSRAMRMEKVVEEIVERS